MIQYKFGNLNKDLTKLQYIDLFQYKFGKNIIKDSNPIKGHLPIILNNIIPKYFKFNNKLNPIYIENYLNTNYIINYFKILYTCLNELHLNNNFAINKDILINNKVDLNFDFNLNLLEMNILDTPFKQEKDITIFKNLYNIVKIINKNQNIDKITFYDNKHNSKLYVFDKQLLVNALCEFLTIHTR